MKIDERKLNYKTLQVFKAVPYAQPPVEALRFESPRKLAPWQGTKLADTFGPVCPQVSFKRRPRESEL